MKWGEVKVGDVVVWHTDALLFGVSPPADVYLMIRVPWARDGRAETVELCLATGEVFECLRVAHLDLDTVKAVLRGGQLVWGTLE